MKNLSEKMNKTTSVGKEEDLIQSTSIKKKARPSYAQSINRTASGNGSIKDNFLSESIEISSDIFKSNLDLYKANQGDPPSEDFNLTLSSKTSID
jgi:hypothetical protein